MEKAPGSWMRDLLGIVLYQVDIIEDDNSMSSCKNPGVGSFMLAFRTYADILSESSESLFTFARPQTETTGNEQEKDLEGRLFSQTNMNSYQQRLSERVSWKVALKQ
jgi:hypothetical protein